MNRKQKRAANRVTELREKQAKSRNRRFRRTAGMLADFAAGILPAKERKKKETT